jgi:adenylate cyclase
MPIEIERKFLVSGDGWRQAESVQYRQGYLNRENELTTRVRIGGGKAFLTIKGPKKAGVTPEFEYEIPVADGEQLLQLCKSSIIQKNRYSVPYKGFTWQVDEFFGDNAGLVMAEIELQDVNQAFERPDWLGVEVTGDRRYYNARLARFPYRTWGEGKPGRDKE